MDRHDLYELCVQSPRHVVTFLRAAHAQGPLVLHEDFCGTAAVSRRWIAEGVSRGENARAVGVDLDADSLARARHEARSAGHLSRLHLVEADVLDPAATLANAPAPTSPPAPDIVFVGNFSIGYIRTRVDLVAYLRAARARLERGNAGWGGGVFVCDTYGGSGAFKLGHLERTHVGREGEIVKYLWRHEAADPITATVTNSISFRVFRAGELVADLPRAFVYEWRLWSIAELREAMMEAGFASVEVHKEVGLAPEESPHPVLDPAELSDDWIVLLVARA